MKNKTTNNQKFWGISAVINLYGCDHQLIQSPLKIKKFAIQLCKLIKMQRHGNPLIERFGSDYYEGVSMMQFIETSSITAHFDEQEDRAFIDIFSCKDFNAKIAADFCQKFFKAKKCKLKIIIRN